MKEALKLALEALEKLNGALEQADCSTGYCCCGSSVDGHTFSDGHSPVDEGGYCQSNALEYARNAIKACEEALKQERKRPQNCGTGYCSCIECVMEQEQGNTKRPVESDYLSYTAYTRALEAYCDEQEKGEPVAYSATSDERLMETPKQEQGEPYLNKAYRLADELRNHLSIAPATQEQGEPVAEARFDGTLHWREPYGIGLHRVQGPLYITPPAQEFVCSTGLCRFTLTQTNVGIGERGMEAYEAAKERGWVGLSDERLMEMPKQEPVAVVTGVYGGRFTCEPLKASVILPAGMALYSSPQQRTWVGLADEEIADCMTWSIKETCKAIEAKLKEKNNG